MTTATKPKPAKPATTALQIRVSDAEVARLEEIAAECNLNVLGAEGHFRRAFMLAAGIRQLERSITDDMMADIMGLMNSPLGFLTDRDPTKPGKNGPPVPYPVGVIKRCAVEALIRGLHFVGNEFNVISGRVYVAKNGFRRLVGEFPGLTDFELTPDIPRSGPAGATIKVRATWKLNGNLQTWEGDFAVRVNDGQGADAIVGKAERKALARIYARLTGSQAELPDGEIADAITVVATDPAAPAIAAEAPAADPTPAKPAPPTRSRLDDLEEKPAAATNATNATNGHAAEPPREPGDEPADELADASADEPEAEPTTEPAGLAAGELTDDEAAELQAEAAFMEAAEAIGAATSAAALFEVGQKIAGLREILDDESMAELRADYEKAMKSFGGPPPAAAPVKRGRGRPPKNRTPEALPAETTAAPTAPVLSGFDPSTFVPTWDAAKPKEWAQAYQRGLLGAVTAADALAMLDYAKRIGASGEAFETAANATTGRVSYLRSKFPA